MTQRKSKPRVVRLKVTANLLESEVAEKIPQAFAYAFSSGGRLLAHKALDEKGQATLALPTAKVARSVRVMVGPEAEEKEVHITDLQRRGAEERILRIDPDVFRPSADLIVIPHKWHCWLLGLCFVRGTLLKRVELEGVSVDLPVCDATVEIYEVDPVHIVLPRLPDTIIEKFRDIIITPPPPPEGPFPPPPEGPFPPPPPEGPFEPLPSVFAGTGTRPESAGAKMASGIQGVAMARAGEAALKNVSNAADFQFLARTTNTMQFRQVLLDHLHLVRPLLCLYFPGLFTKRLVATATTDRCGRFQTFFSRGCHNPDTPDLYFKAMQRLFGFFDVTIYEPTPVPCFTHWNYTCGTEVTLYTSHPLAVTCSPCPPVIAPNNWVLVMAVGNLPLSRIHGTSVPLQATTTPTNLGLRDDGAPFGGLLRLRIEFDNSLREDLGVKYYRVSYRQGTSGSFAPLTASVHRHYTHEIGSDLVLEVYDLGPKVVNGEPNLFEIPPALPPLGQWSFPDLLEDLTNAKFPSKSLAPGADPADPGVIDQSGKYQLKVDLFDQNGNPVDIAAKGIKYRIPAVTDLSGDIDTEDAASLGLVSGNSFIMTLHIDNNVCSASTDAPTLGGVAANECGVLEYDPDAPGAVAMDYTASHPHGFANYRFRLFRGVTLLTPPSTGVTPVGAGSFSTTTPVSTLLGSCPVAGFSENLHVWASATNGWRRLQEYDAHAVRAFVLAPEEEDE